MNIQKQFETIPEQIKGKWIAAKVKALFPNHENNSLKDTDYRAALAIWGEVDAEGCAAFLAEVEPREEGAEGADNGV